MWSPVADPKNDGHRVCEILARTRSLLREGVGKQPTNVLTECSLLVPSSVVVDPVAGEMSP